MTRIETGLPGVWILEPRVHYDHRGYLFESYHRRRLADLGIEAEFVQDNHSHSIRGTLRGLHYQAVRPQAKLCRVAAGEVLDVAVDIRRGSPTFGRWVAVTLSAENRRQLFLPRGFAHGFLVRSESAEFLYKCDDYYDPGLSRGIAWNDPALGIDWGLEVEPILSEADRRLPGIEALSPEELPAFDDLQRAG